MSPRVRILGLRGRPKSSIVNYVVLMEGWRGVGMGIRVGKGGRGGEKKITNRLEGSAESFISFFSFFDFFDLFCHGNELSNHSRLTRGKY